MEEENFEGLSKLNLFIFGHFESLFSGECYFFLNEFPKFNNF